MLAFEEYRFYYYEVGMRCVASSVQQQSYTKNLKFAKAKTDKILKHKFPKYKTETNNFFISFQLGFFAYYTLISGQAEQADQAGPVPFDSLFIYRPDKRQEIWRFLLYMILHAG